MKKRNCSTGQSPPTPSSEPRCGAPDGEHDGKQLQESFFAKIGNPLHPFKLLDFLPDTGYFVKNQEGRIVAMSKNVFQRLGACTEQEVIGLPDATFHPPHIAKAIRKDDCQVMRSGQPLIDRLESLHTSKSARGWFLTTKLPLLDSDGKTCGVMGIVRPCSEGTLKASVPEEVRTTVLHIQKYPAHNLSTSELARWVRRSPRHLNRRFMDALGMSIQEFVLRTRLDCACESLTTTGKPIAEIAYENGFYDQSALCRHFRQQLGVSPLTWRRRGLTLWVSQSVEDRSREFQDSFVLRLGCQPTIGQLLDYLPEVDYFVKDHAGRFVAVGSATLRRVGMRHQEEILGKTDGAIHPPAIAHTIRQDDLRIMATLQPIVNHLEFLYTRTSAKGSYLTTKMPVTDPQGRAIGIMGFVKPVTGNMTIGAQCCSVQRILQHIREHYNERLKISELAKLGGISPRHMHRLFQDSFHLSVQEFIIRMRVDAASRDLLDTSRSIAEIANLHGFCDSSTFTRQFRSHVGMNPHSYRRRNRKSP